MQHKTVLLNEAVNALCCKKQGIYIDGTFGRGGHSKAILEKLDSTGKVLAIDKDPEAFATGRELSKIDSRFTIKHGSFASMSSLIDYKKVDGILLDLGISSPQIDNPERGFSFMQDGPLDMRMNHHQGISASEWLATATAEEIANILWVYGEERYSRRIARSIVDKRTNNPIVTTKHLAKIVSEAHPKWEKNKHPATRSFQAIRIFINNELGDLEKALSQSVELLNPKGRLVIISFHSLEDRIVKRFIKQESSGKYEEIPRWVNIPSQEHKHSLKRIGKAIKPFETEVKNNIRARSAIMRIAEKC